METQRQKQGTWCLISVANKEVKARITHVGRGKFRILEGAGGEHSNLKIDASDVIHCRE